MTSGIRHALDVLFPSGGVVELRALTDHAIHSGYFDNFDELVRKAESLEAIPEVAGIYVTLNEVEPALLSHRANRVKMNLGRKDPSTSDSDILRRRWLPIDLDPVRPSGVSSTDEEHASAIARAKRIAAWLFEQEFPDPVVADSGNGAHLLYRIDLPNDDTSLSLVKEGLGILDTLFSDESVSVDTANFNAARIWKLYGTTSRKGDDTTERPHRKAQLLRVPDQVAPVSITHLQQLVGTVPAKDPGIPKKSRGGPFDLRAWLSEHGILIRTERPWQGGILFALDECPFSSSHRDGAFAIQFPSGAIHAGCHHTTCGGGRQRWQELRERYELRKQPSKTKSVEDIRSGPQSSAPSPPAISSDARSQAEEAIRTADPLTFLLDVFHREHVGDRVVAECLVMSVASQSVANTQGLHVAISGNSGKGKTHACRAMLNLLPEQFRIKGTVSDKALYYHPVQPGTVLLFDDVSLSEDLQEILKSATANFREPIEHRTLTSDRQVRVCTIPERCVWWLAKVEMAGDDQVMNRMLCVWIDDSEAQDDAVLAHLKAAEVRGLVSGEDPDVVICRALWELVKEQVFHVRVPFATRIRFSCSQNRRNPAMLFDLIKCHARLFFLQRGRDADESIIANLDDFEYARRLFIEITGETGALETKQTRNEAAALATIAKMGLEVFTIKQLQDAIGLSYHQVYRLLRGYHSSRGTYSGILDKCPAVSYIDATVAEDLYGIEVKRREHYFSFDIGLYKSWAAQAEIWLDEEQIGYKDNPDLHTFASDLHHVGAKKVGCEKEDREDSNKTIGERGTSSDPSLQQLSGAHSVGHEPTNASSNVSDMSIVVNARANSSGQASFIDSGNQSRSLIRAIHRKESQSTEKGGNHSKQAQMNPLPGVLDHREFVKVHIISGKCDVCGKESAVYRCKEKHAGICERCYANLVREWNSSKGIS